MSRIVLITGASRGIGAATAKLAASRGYDVCINYRQDADAARAVAAEVSAAGRRAAVVQADVANEADIVRLFETCDRELGRLTALVNNAGILETQMRVEAMDAVRLQRVFAANVAGSFLCAREAVKRMSTKHGGPGGAIVNVSSGAARLGPPGEYVDYAASKGRSTLSPSASRRKWQRTAFASTPCVQVSSTPTFTPAAASRIGLIASRRPCR